MHRPIILLFAFVASSTLASPALQPGDVGLRHDIQVLADYGVIRGPVQQTLQRLLARAE